MTDGRPVIPPRTEPWQETILRLKGGEEAPEGFEILRILGIYDEPILGPHTLVERVYVVAARRITDV